jgi:hypothetical protein
MLSLADSDGAVLTDGDEDEEAVAVILLDGDDDSESEGAADFDGDDDTDGAVTDDDDDAEATAVLDDDDDSEGAVVGDTLRCSQHRASNTTPGVSEKKQGRESNAGAERIVAEKVVSRHKCTTNKHVNIVEAAHVRLRS